jgi:biotin carboxylase
VPPRILFVLPTAWDQLELRCGAVAPWRERYELVAAGPADDDVAWDWDWSAWLDAATREHAGVAGVTSSSDYPGCLLGALLARRLGLPGPEVGALLRASHKYYARIAQAAAAPADVPRFAVLDPEAPCLPAGLAFPCFVKPVKSSFSMFARAVRSQDELLAHVQGPAARDFVRHFPHIFNQLLRAHSDLPLDASRFVAEELVTGEQVTLEGFVYDGQVEVLAVVDSIVHPVTRSFTRFDLPSRLPEAVQATMADVCRRVVLALGLERTMFNVELFWAPDTGRISVIEVNPRMCGQFADLYEKVLGTSGYEVACALAAGERPRVQRDAGPCRVAASVPLRVFEPARVVRSPTLEDVRAAEALFPGTRIWTLARAGEVLDEFERHEDGASHLYAVINLGADDRDDLARRLALVVARLGYALEPLAARVPTP